MRLKAGVRTTGIQSALVLAVLAADYVYRQHGAELVITSIVDGIHSVGSLHYVGAAFDARTRHLANGLAQVITGELRERLADDFDVVLEPDHIHVEWQPKQPL